MIRRDDIQNNFGGSGFEYRTVESYDKHMRMVEMLGDKAISECGFRGHCLLNELTSWHVVKNWAGDIFHDFLEGNFFTFSFIMSFSKSVLKHFSACSVISILQKKKLLGR